MQAEALCWALLVTALGIWYEQIKTTLTLKMIALSIANALGTIAANSLTAKEQAQRFEDQRHAAKEPSSQSKHNPSSPPRDSNLA